MKIVDVKRNKAVSLFRYLRTIRHLKVEQIYFRIFYIARNRWREWTGYSLPLPPYKKPLGLDLHFPNFIGKLYQGDNTFEFLNKNKVFSSGIDWNFMGYGQLWNYNLLYFDYVQQPGLKIAEKSRLIHNFLDHFDDIRFAKDPYPLSLRCINWIKYLINNNIQDQKIEHSIYQQYYLLLDNIEYHLLGNHLLENSFSLLVGGLYFDDEILICKAKQILSTQLDEQIFRDGGHFERSSMYHQLLLYRLLDCYNILEVRDQKKEELRHFLRNTVERMLGWLAKITFNNGTIPYINDATQGIAPTTKQLMEYAHQLEMDVPDISLDDSGYRMIRSGDYEWLIDVGDIGPDYIPGHAHSDTFSFVLYVRDKPVIVDAGISTYEEGERRIAERSTISHNTVMINGEEQTEVWKSFRVGRRAYVTKREEESNYISAEHDGYQHLGLTHCRTFRWGAKTISTKDVVGGGNTVDSKAYLHFHPGIHVRKQGEEIITDDIAISFSGSDYFQIKDYKYAEGFNKLKPASVVEIKFRNKLETHIKL